MFINIDYGNKLLKGRTVSFIYYIYSKYNYIRFYYSKVITLKITLNYYK